MQRRVSCIICGLVHQNIQLLWAIVYVNTALLALCCGVAAYKTWARPAAPVSTVPVSVSPSSKTALKHDLFLALSPRVDNLVKTIIPCLCGADVCVSWNSPRSKTFGILCQSEEIIFQLE